MTVVVAAHGYPGTVRAGDEIEGVADAEALPGVHVLHAGTARSGEGALVSAGGRVLSVVGVGADIDAARERAYAGVELIALRGSQHRTDIAAQLPEPPDPPAQGLAADEPADEIHPAILDKDDLR